MPDLRHNISLEASLYRVPGFYDTIALKRLCTVWQIYVIIFPLKRLYTVCQAYVTQLSKNVCVLVPGFVTIFPLKRLCTFSQAYVTQLP